MPAPADAEELFDLIRRSDLIPSARLEPALAALDRRAEPRTLAGRLIEAGVITQFHAAQFLQGKYRGFTLGNYRVLERLGAGGMGTVYLAEHATMGRKAALKVLPVSQASNPASLGRFYREARAAGSLDHPNLVKAHDIDEENGLHFLVMDYVDGSSLQEIVSRFGPMSILRACHCMKQAAEGLQHAYQSGLIHRDVKPANILLERTGRVRVLDLGLARFFGDNTDLLTLKYDEKHVLGTADYVSPEQAIDSHDVDQRADVYSLGGTFYFLLAGRPPFPEGKIAQKLLWQQVRQPTPLTQLRPDMPAELAQLVEKMMAKDPAARFQTHAQVAMALEPWTEQPAPLPREEEMPQLCRAARTGMVLQGGESKPLRRPQPRPLRPSDQGKVATLSTSPPAMSATPFSMPRADTRAETRAEPRAAPRGPKPATPPARSWMVLLAVVLGLAGAAIGTALAWLQRF